jgi:hypothetical protein
MNTQTMRMVAGWLMVTAAVLAPSWNHANAQKASNHAIAPPVGHGFRSGQRVYLDDPCDNGLVQDGFVTEAVPVSHGKWAVPKMRVRFRHHLDKLCSIPVARLQTLHSTAKEVAYLAWLQQTARSIIQKRWHIDTSKVPIKVLSGPACYDKPFAHTRQLGPFLYEHSVGASNYKPPSCREQRFLAGFSTGGRVYLHRTTGAFDMETIVHELLHATSQNFSLAAKDHGYRALVEGLTEYMTNETIRAYAGAPLDDESSYYQRPALFIDQVARRVGESRLRSIYFSHDEDPLEELRHALGPKQVGWFDEKASLLERVTYTHESGVVPLASTR